MSVTYSGKMKIGGGGIGSTAYRQVKPLIEEKMLKAIYAPEVIDELKNFHISIPSTHPADPYIVQDFFFDYYTSLVMEEPEIIQGWMSHCYAQLFRYPRAIAVVNLFSAYPLEQAKMMGELYTNDTVMIKKAIDELMMCDHIFVPSDFILQSLRPYGLAEKAKVVPFGVDLEKFTPKEKEDDIFRVIFVGGAWQRKGLIYLLAAWDKLRLPNAELIVAGGVKELTSDIPNVKWGWVPDLVKAYQSADVFCLPALEDGCPLATYEAMACGLVPIVSENTGTKQHIYPGYNGFMVQPKNPRNIAEILEELYNNRDRCKDMGRRAREVIKEYTWERHEQEYIKWMKSI